MNVAFDLPALPGGAPSVNADIVSVFGCLLLWDDPSVGNITIQASFVYVFGFFLVGSPTRHFS